MTQITFFKLSAARRGYYKLMQMITEIEAKFALRHVIGMWLAIKYPVLCLPEQWENINEYFFKYIPTTDNYKKLIKTNARYERIITFLRKSTSKADLCFIAFVSHDFEEFLTKMQSNKPMVHLMFEMMSSLLYNLMKRFVSHSAITTSVDGHTKANQGSDVVTVYVSKYKKKI